MVYFSFGKLEDQGMIKGDFLFHYAKVLRGISLPTLAKF